MSERIRAAFVLEQHVGHRTYAENLRAAIDARDDIESTWIPVTYGEHRAGPLGALRSILVGRSEARAGVRTANVDVRVFNTQVPAALGGRLVRSDPYIAVTDVTPVQYDTMADAYGRRPDGSGPVARWKHHVNRRVFNGAAVCVGWSSWAASSIVSDYGVRADAVKVIPPGVDTAMWSSAPPSANGGDVSDQVRLLFIGGDFVRKGGDMLIDAFAAVSDRAELVLVTKSHVAPGPGITVVNDLAPNDPRLVELVRSCSAFVLPSRGETFGIAALEASAVGLPVVASDIGGLADIVVDDVTGFRIPVDDVDALARTLVRLVDHPDLRQRLGAGARDRAVEHYDAVTNGNRMAELVRSVGHGTRR